MYIFSIKLEDFMEHLVFTLVTFVLFTALVGIISGKIVKNSDDQKTAKGYSLPEMDFEVFSLQAQCCLRICRQKIW